MRPEAYEAYINFVRKFTEVIGSVYGELRKGQSPNVNFMAALEKVAEPLMNPNKTFNSPQEKKQAVQIFLQQLVNGKTKEDAGKKLTEEMTQDVASTKYESVYFSIFENLVNLSQEGEAIQLTDGVSSINRLDVAHARSKFRTFMGPYFQYQEGSFSDEALWQELNQWKWEEVYQFLKNDGAEFQKVNEGSLFSEQQYSGYFQDLLHACERLKDHETRIKHHNDQITEYLDVDNRSAQKDRDEQLNKLRKESVLLEFALRKTKAVPASTTQKKRHALSAQQPTVPPAGLSNHSLQNEATQLLRQRVTEIQQEIALTEKGELTPTDNRYTKRQTLENTRQDLEREARKAWQKVKENPRAQKDLIKSYRGSKQLDHIAEAQFNVTFPLLADRKKLSKEQREDIMWFLKLMISVQCNAGFSETDAKIATINQGVTDVLQDPDQTRRPQQTYWDDEY